MSKTLTVNYEGKSYTLEFTRRTVEGMERDGFSVKDLEDKPMSTLPKLFEGAFKANHRFVKREIIDKIFENIKEKNELIGKLAEMYAEPLTSLFSDPEESEGNATWTADW